MKVRAVTKGFYGGQLREAGELFTATEGEKSSWFVAVEDAENAPAAAVELPAAAVAKPRAGR
jgi:hypothetical protein